MRPDGLRLELHDDNGRSYRFVRSLGGAFVPERDRPEVTWEEILLLTDGMLEARIVGGMVQTYERGKNQGLYLLVEKRDANGHWVRLSWKDDLLVRIENDGGAYVEVERGTSHRRVAEADSSHHLISALRDSAGRIVRYGYDIHGLLVESIAPGNAVTRWAYDGMGRLNDAQDALGRRLLTAEYDTDGRVSAFQMSGARLRFEHDRVTHVTSVLDAAGARTLIQHDLEGRAVRVIDATGYENSLVYGEAGDLVEHRDSQGGSTRHAYARHLLTQAEMRDGSSTLFAYDGDGRLTSFTDPRGAVTHYSYDGRGNLLSVTDALGYTRSGAYDGSGNLIEYTDALERTTQFDHDAFGRPTLVVEPDGSRWEVEYDPRGPISRVTRPDGESVEVRFDEAGRRVGVVTPEGLTQDAAYDEGGLLSSYLDRYGRRFDLRYDDAGRLESVATAGGNSAFYSYDANGRLTWIRRAEGPSTEFGYDARNQVSWLRNWPGEVMEFRHDGEGQLVESRLEGGSSATYSYDRAGRLRSRVLPDGTAEHLEHDSAGNLVRITTPSSDLAMEYDALNRPTGVSRLDLDRSVSLGYDRAGNRLEMRSDDGAYITYAYDELNRLVQVEDSVRGRYELGYDGASRRRSWLRTGNGVGTSYAYDRAGRMVSYEVRSPNGKLIDREAYSRDGNGNVVAQAMHPEAIRQPPVERLSVQDGSVDPDPLFHPAGPIAEIDPETGSIALVNDLDTIGPQVINVAAASLRRFSEPQAAGGALVAPIAGILPLLGGDSRLRLVTTVASPPFVGHFYEMQSLLETIEIYSWLPPFSGLERSFVLGGLMSQEAGPPGFSAADASSHEKSAPLIQAGIRQESSSGGARWEFSTAQNHLYTEPIAIVGGSLIDPDRSPSIETPNPIGPEEDPPVWQECPDQYGFCDAGCSGSNPLCSGGWGGGGGGNGGGGGGEGGSCTLSVSPPSATAGIGETISFTANAVGCTGIPTWTASGGSPPSGSGTSFSVFFQAAATFTVSVSVDGLTAQATATVVAPSCNFTVSASPSSPYIGDSVTLTASGNCVEYSWSTQSTACPGAGGVNPWTTKFIQAGSRFVNVAGENAYGNLTIKPFNLTVQACTTSLSGPSSANVGESVCYSPSVTAGTSGTYTWTATGGIPDSQSGPASSFCTSFPTAGTFTVSLGFEKSVSGCSPVACLGSSQQVTVSTAPPPPPTVQINLTNPLALLQESTGSATATGRDGFGNPVSGSYSWTTSNPAVLALTPNGSQAMLSGNSAGSSVLTVTFTTSEGSDTDQITVYVSELTVVSITTIEADAATRRYFDLASLYMAEADPVAVTASITPDLPVDVAVTGSAAPLGAGTFAPPSVSGRDQVTSTFSATTIDVSTDSAPVYLGYSASGGVVDEVPAILVEQELVRMMYGEGACRPSRERMGLAWAARNRIGDPGFSPPQNLTLAQIVRQAGQFSGYWPHETRIRSEITTGLSRTAYDGCTDEGGTVQQSLAADPTLGSVGFITPEDVDLLALLAAYDSGATQDAQDLVGAPPGFNGDYQVVLVHPRVTFEDAASGGGSGCDNPFVYFRRKQANEPSVVFNP